MPQKCRWPAAPCSPARTSLRRARQPAHGVPSSHGAPARADNSTPERPHLALGSPRKKTRREMCSRAATARHALTICLETFSSPGRMRHAELAGCAPPLQMATASPPVYSPASAALNESGATSDVASRRHTASSGTTKVGIGRDREPNPTAWERPRQGDPAERPKRGAKSPPIGNSRQPVTTRGASLTGSHSPSLFNQSSTSSGAS
jgi:hypothetical protein